MEKKEIGLLLKFLGYSMFLSSILAGLYILEIILINLFSIITLSDNLVLQDSILGLSVYQVIYMSLMLAIASFVSMETITKITKVEYQFQWV